MTLSIPTLLISAFIVAGIGAGICYFILSMTSLPVEERTSIIKNWLLYAVAAAEKEFGSGTGKLKFAKVYNEFIEKFPEFAVLVSYEEFSKLVDEALSQLKDMLKNNKINQYIEG